MNIVLSHHDLPLHIYADGKEIHNGGQRLISCRLLEQGTPSWVDQRRRAVDTFDQHKARWFQDLDQNKAWWFFEDSAMNYFLKEMNLWFRCWRASALKE